MGICVSRCLRLMMNSMRKRTVSVQTQTKQNIQRSTLVFVMFVVNHLVRKYVPEVTKCWNGHQCCNLSNIWSISKYSTKLLNKKKDKLYIKYTRSFLVSEKKKKLKPQTRSPQVSTKYPGFTFLHHRKKQINKLFVKCLTSVNKLLLCQGFKKGFPAYSHCSRTMEANFTHLCSREMLVYPHVCIVPQVSSFLHWENRAGRCNDGTHASITTLKSPNTSSLKPWAI